MGLATSCLLSSRAVRYFPGSNLHKLSPLPTTGRDRRQKRAAFVGVCVWGKRNPDRQKKARSPERARALTHTYLKVETDTTSPTVQYFKRQSGSALISASRGHFSRVEVCLLSQTVQLLNSQVP